MPPSFPKRNRKAAFPVKSPMITSFSPLLLPLWAEERVTDIQFYFVVLIDIFYYGRGLGHTFGVRVDGPLARGFLRFLSLTAFQAEGCGLPLCGNAYKVSVTGLAFWVRWHDKHYVDQPPPVAFPPLVPYGTTFPPRWEACHTILRSLCSLTNRVPLPPLSGGTIKSRKAIPS